MKYVSKMGEFSDFPKGLRLSGKGGLNEQADQSVHGSIYPSGLNAPLGWETLSGSRVVLWCKQQGRFLSLPTLRPLCPVRAPWIVQNKTGARLGIEVTGELAAVIARISERPRRAISAWLVQDENGQPLTSFALRSRFDKARTLAKVDFQFRDIRAKAATDTGDLAHSQKLLAHKNRDMTENYVRSRIGERVKPLR